ncbi:MAG: hypothetical protein U0840_12720 [Gemmataceae bacterium]
MTTPSDPATRPRSLLPSSALTWTSALLGAAAAGASAWLYRDALPAPLGMPLACALHACTGALLGILLVHLLALLLRRLSVRDDPAWTQGILDASQATVGLRVITDDPATAIRQQMHLWREHLGDRAALVSILGGLVGVGWLFWFLLAVPGDLVGVPRANHWLLLVGLGQAAIVLAGTAFVVALGNALWRRTERACLRTLPTVASPLVARPAPTPVPIRRPEPPPPEPQLRQGVPTLRVVRDDDDTPPLPPD